MYRLVIAGQDENQNTIHILSYRSDAPLISRESMSSTEVVAYLEQDGLIEALERDDYPVGRVELTMGARVYVSQHWPPEAFHALGNALRTFNQTAKTSRQAVATYR